MRRPAAAAGFCLALALAGCSTLSPHQGKNPTLNGAWRSSVKFTSGSLASVNGLQFMYVFNEGGTLTESSNYDAAPPVPPAYGVWRETGLGTYEAKYEFFISKAPAKLDEITAGGGWSPAGRGVLKEEITLSEDGRAFRSLLHYQGFDAAGRPVDEGEASGSAQRIGF